MQGQEQFQGQVQEQEFYVKKNKEICDNPFNLRSKTEHLPLNTEHYTIQPLQQTANRTISYNNHLVYSPIRCVFRIQRFDLYPLR